MGQIIFSLNQRRDGLDIMISRAKKIIAVSEFTKNDILKRFDLPEDKIRVIYEAAGDIFRPVKDKTVLKNMVWGGNIFCQWPTSASENLIPFRSLSFTAPIPKKRM